MTDGQMDRFEDALGRRLRAASDQALRPFEPTVVASQAAVSPVPRALRGRSPWRARRLLVLVLAATVGGGTLFAASGGFRQRSVAPVAPGPSAPLTGLATASPRLTPTAPPAASTPTGPAGGCLGLDEIAQVTGAVVGGWTPGPAVDPGNPVANGLIAGVSAADGSIRLLDPQSWWSPDRVLTNLGGYELTPVNLVWSPGGANLAYVAEYKQPGENPFWCQLLFDWSQETQSLTLMTTGGDQSPAWAPDESAIAVVSWPTRDEDSLRIISADLSTVRDLGTYCAATECGGLVDQQWSPDGSRIAVTSDNGSGQSLTSAIVDVGDGTWTELPVGWGITRWLDSETLLVWSEGAVSATVSVTSNPTTLLEPANVEWPPSSMRTSPDFAHALDWKPCSGARLGPCRVLVRDRASATDRVVWSVEAGVATPFWSPDSRSILIAVWDGAPGDVGIWTVRVDGSSLHKVSDTPMAKVAWQPVRP